MRRLLACAVVLAALAACGEDEDEPAPAARDEPTVAPVETAAPASSPRECIDVWNEQARLGTAGQKSPTDYLVEAVEEGFPEVFVALRNGECLVVAELPRRRAYVFVAPGGRAPFGHPSQIGIPKGRGLRPNGRATEEGVIEPG
jgi:hypothetical protein